jgi:hypothetical protein
MPKKFTRKNKLPSRFDIGKSNFTQNFVLRDEADPYIPGTRIRRLKLTRLGPRSVGAFDDEIERVQSELAAIPYIPQPVKRKQPQPSQVKKKKLAKRPRIATTNEAVRR